MDPGQSCDRFTFNTSRVRGDQNMASIPDASILYTRRSIVPVESLPNIVNHHRPFTLPIPSRATSICSFATHSPKSLTKLPNMPRLPFAIPQLSTSNHASTSHSRELRRQTRSSRYIMARYLPTNPDVESRIATSNPGSKAPSPNREAH